MRLDRIIIGIVLLLVCLGIGVRLYNITQNQFVYYDEGLYLNHNIDFMYYVDEKPPQNFSQFIKYLNICFHVALADTKTLWFFLANMRAFLFDSSALFFTRLLSAIFGCLTLGIIYLTGRRCFNSSRIGLIAAGLLAILPSHIYYSRLGLQEGLSTFLFACGIYWYLSSRRFSIKTLLSGVFFAGVFFTNYRMIIIPLVVFALEFFVSWAQGSKFDVRKFIYNTLVFLIVVLGLGSLDDGANTRITFGWMFHQAHLSKDTFSFINLFSYPYYIFKLESLIFGLLFFGNIYLIIKRQWKLLWPFGLVMLFMIIFSLPQEKGVRYLCAVMPFMCLATAILINYILEQNQKKTILILGGVVAILIGLHTWQAAQIMNYRPAYVESIQDLKDKHKIIRVISTQPVVHKVIAGQKSQIHKPVTQLKHLIWLHSQGFQYFIIGPQAFVSYTEDGARFNPKLTGFFEFIKRVAPAEKTYTHFNRSLMERFVLEHNVNLLQSLRFLKNNKDGKLGELYVYDIKKILYLAKRLSTQHEK